MNYKKEKHVCKVSQLSDCGLLEVSRKEFSVCTRFSHAHRTNIVL